MGTLIGPPPIQVRVSALNPTSVTIVGPPGIPLGPPSIHPPPASVTATAPLTSPCPTLAHTLALARSYSIIFRMRDVDMTPQVLSEFADFLDRCSNEFRIAAVQETAEHAARNFVWPAGALDRDSLSLARLGSIEAVITEVQDIHKPGGFNIERVNTHYGADQDVALLREIALTGAIVDTSPAFTRLTRQQMERPITRALPNAMAQHAHKLWSKGKVILLRLADLTPAQLNSLSFVGVHLAYKPDDPLGRLCIDPSNAPEGVLPLNNPVSKTLSIQRYTKLVNPTVKSIFESWIAFKTAHGYSWPMLYIHKEDVSSAFPQFSMAPASALWLCCEILLGILLIMIAGSFGWTGAPVVYDIIGKAMLRALIKVVEGPLAVYCDDFIGLGTHESAARDQALVIRQIKNTFGPTNSHNEEKDVLAQEEKILGWWTNLPANAVRPSDRAIRKLCHYFFRIDTSIAQPLQEWQNLASLAEHYSAGLFGMNNFVTPLHAMARRSERTHLNRATANSAARFVIEIWRMVAIRLWQDAYAFKLSIEQFVGCNDALNARPTRFAKSDASTPRVAVGIYTELPNGEWELLCWSGYNFPFQHTALEAKKYQAQREYLGLLLSLTLNFCYTAGLPGGLMLEINHRPLTWVNDNSAAVVWANDARTKSAAAQTASLAVTFFQLESNIHLQHVYRIPGAQMGDIDRQSRIHEPGMTSPSLTMDKYVHLQEHIDASGLFAACDPASTRQNEKDHHLAFQNIHACIQNLLRSCISTYSTHVTNNPP